jgi:hypothetical protein
MPYTHFRFIAYEVPTATYSPGGPVASGFAPGPEPPPVVRLPVPGNVPDDARIRLKRFAGVVDLAANRLHHLGGDNANTLKIFMAPEFYFRPPVASGFNFNHDTYPDTHANRIFQALNSMFTHADFQHWLFIPGTVMWNTSHDASSPIVYFNTATHVRGGRINGLHIIEKRLASGIDGVPVDRAPAMDPHLAPIFQDWTTRKSHVWEDDHVSFGLEICLDHANYDFGRILKRVLAAWPGREGADRNVQLHLLTAGGMDITAESVAAIPHGYILRNDGLPNPGARSEIRQVASYRVPDLLIPGHFIDDDLFFDPNGTANLGAPLAATNAFDIPAGPLRVPMRGAPYAEFPQRLVYYPACAIP